MSLPDQRSEACAAHPDRAGVLRVELPGLRIRRFLCDECTKKLSADIRGIVFNYIPPWLKALRTGAPEKDALYAYRERTAEGLKGQITWRHPYDK